MSETVEQYVQRIRGNLDGKDPLTVLQATTPKLSSLVSGKTEDQLRKRPAPDKWSAAEIVIHLAEVELVMGFRVRLILGCNGTAIPAFDQDQWAKRYGNAPFAMALEMHRAVRAANLALYQSLSSEQWEQYGIHSERGKETIKNISKLHAGHDVNHLKQIENILR
jgi:hypothetical protein